MDPDFGKVVPFAKEHEATFQRYKAGIEKAVKQAFPSLPSDFEARPVGVRAMNACAMIYTYMILLPDGKYAKVDFTVGGLPAPGTPINREPNFRVDPEPKTKLND